MLYLIATDKCYCDVTVYSCVPQEWIRCVYGEAGDHYGSCDFYRQSLRNTGVTGEFKESLKTTSMLRLLHV